VPVEGRSCPLSYRYRPEDLAGPATPVASTLYVVGGLYGNTAALDAVLRRADREPSRPTIVFNGDFHYLDVDPDAFRRIAETVAAHHAIRGNIEAEIADPQVEAGCGCGYPDYVDDQVVERSNEIVTTLQAAAGRFPELLAPLRALPRFLTVEVGGRRVAVVHGDPENLAGWRLAVEAVEPGDQEVRSLTGWRGEPTTGDVLGDWFRRMDVQVLACTHTGLPYAQDHLVDDDRRLVINNGCAGLPCFTPPIPGVITRISTQTAIPADSLYGIGLGGLRADALPLRYDLPTWSDEFARRWPPGSPAHASYHRRITDGTQLTLGHAARGNVVVHRSATSAW
jgi:hypothetical protein